MKNHLLIIGRSVVLFVIASTVAFGQSPASFTGPRAYLGNDAAIADFNGDGILDLATIDQVSNAIHFHSGLGNGTFAHDTSVLTMIAGSRNLQLATGDLNGDGIPDLVVGLQLSTGPTAIQILLGKAGGGFVREPAFTSLVPFLNFYLADLNSDGHPDLIVVSGNEIGVLLGDGDGTFQPETPVFSQQLQVASLAIADFNGDGIPDLAVPVVGGMFILFGDGTGKFPTGTTFTTTETFGPVAAADLNGDGKQDLVVEFYDKGSVEVLLGEGNGTFGAPQVYFITTLNETAAYGLAVGDINGDGILDIVTPDPAVLIGKGDGTFDNPVLLPANDYWQSLQLADLRGIGQLDVVGNVANGSFLNTTVLLNEGLGTFQDDQALRLAGFPTDCLAVADFNRDGHDDVAVGAQSGVDVFLGTGQLKALVPSLSLAINEGCPFAGDFNNDGIPDLLVKGYGHLAFFAGVGDGTFASPVTTSVRFNIAAIGDFNGDGTLDVAGFVHPNIQVLIGNGSGAFTHFASIPEPSGALSIVAADLNGDGLTDLVVLIENPYQVTVFLNQGSGSFTSSTFPLPTTFTAYSALVADVNKDGIPDLVVVGSPDTYVFLGQGAGVFSQVSELAASGRLGAIADLNGDGFPDLVLVDGYATKVFLGNGTGTFSYPGNPDGLWFGTAVPTAVAPAFLQSQTPASGLADLITVGEFIDFSYVGVLLNQALLQ